ncbi:hypothetical protein GCM10011579_005720 [Streptomyces albiflavescens]|uniref:Uncharacterized protein n=1 Tax=Streptomyces albiflavescens TaxID=1623582 RepID=A0A918CZ46_9ACTN|nr:hypothetical protein GCM10011579_005720 [Streptomyces albiflavescens]
MPRLPTIRVIGSQAISIRPLPSPAAFFVGAIVWVVPFFAWVVREGVDGSGGAAQVWRGFTTAAGIRW